MKESRTMDIARARDLLDAYGADPARWPAAERTALSAFIAEFPEAARARDRAEMLDRVLDRAGTQAPSDRVRAQILSAAPIRSDDWLESLRAAFGSLWRPAAALAFSLVVGIGLDLMNPAFEPEDDEVALLVLGPGWDETR